MITEAGARAEVARGDSILEAEHSSTAAIVMVVPLELLATPPTWIQPTGHHTSAIVVSVTLAMAGVRTLMVVLGRG